MRAWLILSGVVGLSVGCTPSSSSYGGRGGGGAEPAVDTATAPSQLGGDTLATADSGGDTGEAPSTTDSSAPEPDSGAPDLEPSAAPLLQFDGPAPRNVLLISIDTLRKDYVGRYAGGHSLTPTLDHLLSDGLALDQHRSCSDWTYPAMLCALSGQYNLDLGYVPSAGGDSRDIEPVRDDGSMVSQNFGDAGFQTGFVSTSPFLSVETGFNRVYDEMRYDIDWRGDKVVLEGLTMLDGFMADGDPWLLHLHFLDPHAPYDPPRSYYDGAPTSGEFDVQTPDGVTVIEQVYPELNPSEQHSLEDYIRKMYAGEVSFVDAQIGVMLKAMDERGVLDDTLVVFWSDHGEQLFDRGTMEHGHLLHSEESDAIAGFWAANLISAHTDLETSHRDLVPTLLAGMGLPDAREVPGRVLSTDSESEPTFALKLNESETEQSVDSGHERLLYSWDGSLEYYDLSTDPGELNDQYAPDSARVLALWELLAPDVDRLAAYYAYATPVPPTLRDF